MGGLLFALSGEGWNWVAMIAGAAFSAVPVVWFAWQRLLPPEWPDD